MALEEFMILDLLVKGEFCGEMQLDHVYVNINFIKMI